jgi:hypothetical protein
MDEWFKPTWIVQYMESMGFYSGSTFITTRQLWHNLCSPEQNFGLVSFDPSDALQFTSYQLDKTGVVSDIQASYDNQYFQLSVTMPANISNGDTLKIAFDTYKKDIGESMLPGNKQASNRAEFMLEIPFGKDTANYYVTQVYNLRGLTPRFLAADTIVQKFKSKVTDGNPWVLMQIQNEDRPDAVQNIGKIKVKNLLQSIATANHHGVFWEGNKLRVRIPWTMLYFSDPTQLEVVNGFTTPDGGWNWDPIRAHSDGIAISIVKGNNVVNTTNRYTWPSWLVTPSTVERDKASLGIVKQGLSEVSDLP